LDNFIRRGKTMNRVLQITVLFLMFILLTVPTVNADRVPPSQKNPGNFEINEVPQFVVIGFDDNTEPAPLQWMLDFLKDKVNPSGVGNKATYDGTPARVSFYMSPQYNGGNQALRALVKRAYDEGHELGNHTVTHPHNYKMDEVNWVIEEILMDESEWTPEIDSCTGWLKSCGVPEDKIAGFRNPFLETSASSFNTINTLGLIYDCSIEEGYQTNQNGTNYLWPYTLDWGSPGNEILVGWGSKAAVPVIAGLWEVPNHAAIVPPDNVASQYGFTSGLRTRMSQLQGWFDPVGGKVTGFDYNIWANSADGAFELKSEEVCAIMKYSLDLRYENNRAPFMFGAHTQFYDDSWSVTNATNATTTQMRKAIEDFIDYALTKDDVRIVPAIKIIEWCRNPVKLSTVPIIHSNSAGSSMVRPSIGAVTLKSVSVTVPEMGNYSLQVYTSSGKRVSVIKEGFLGQGSHIIPWKGGNFSSQLYLFTLEGRNTRTVKKVVF
jgi:hypothetical protein